MTASVVCHGTQGGVALHQVRLRSLDGHVGSLAGGSACVVGRMCQLRLCPQPCGGIQRVLHVCAGTLHIASVSAHPKHTSTQGWC